MATWKDKPVRIDMTVGELIEFIDERLGGVIDAQDKEAYSSSERRMLSNYLGHWIEVKSREGTENANDASVLA